MTNHPMPAQDLGVVDAFQRYAQPLGAGVGEVRGALQGRAEKFDDLLGLQNSELALQRPVNGFVVHPVEKPSRSTFQFLSDEPSDLQTLARVLDLRSNHARLFRPLLN